MIITILQARFVFNEIQGDLFNSSDSLVHCVSRDLHMGKGIATVFKAKFGGVDELQSQRKLMVASPNLATLSNPIQNI
jgi:hypothetical protein